MEDPVHSVYQLHFGKQIALDEGESGEDGNPNDIISYSLKMSLK